MREIRNINPDWKFTLSDTENEQINPEWQTVSLPHTWNNYDGQDGGANYHTGVGTYAKEVNLGTLKPGSRVFIEVQAAANAGQIFVNGKKAAEHEGGFSIFRADITDDIHDGDNLIELKVDNTPRADIYPQMADFTFYGGLYRDVNILIVPETHFDLSYQGSQGIAVSSKIVGGNADLTINCWIKDPQAGDSLQIVVTDADGNEVDEVNVPAKAHTTAKAFIPSAHLWQGVKDAYLYTVTASIRRHNEILDEVAVRHGVREYYVDPQKGFYLNGVLTPLRGVSRHQDQLDKGNALTYEDHKLDADMIKELGANTIRLAHYQHSQDFYDLCDEYGFITWAEIPFISKMNPAPEAHDNAMNQMEELIIQNYNHPSILFWGISNEITIGGDSEELQKNLNALNDLARELDPTRLTTMAQVSSLPKDNPQNQITDVLSYNHYFGWYGGKLEDNEDWLDEFHEMHPDRALGVSEYGCEGIVDYHNDNPKVGDYSEEHQALYHEHMARIIDERPWLWATHIWNMFDFGCDARDEGGVKGRNNKGLMTIDRKLKKDSFYLYKAYWSDEPFVHIASKRYSNRTGDTTTIKVYSNQPYVSLFAEDGQLIDEKYGEKVFEFTEVPLHEGTNRFTAVSGDQKDSIRIDRVDVLPESYTLVEDPDNIPGVTNWFDDVDVDSAGPITIDENFYSVKDTIGDVAQNPEAFRVLLDAVSSLMGMALKPSMTAMMQDSTLEDMAKFGGKEIGEKKLAYLNSQLQKYKK